MRAPIALAIYVCLVTVISAAGSFAEGPVSIKKNASDGLVPDSPVPNWITVYNAGLAANQRHDHEESLDLFKQSWETSRTAEQRGASATGLGQTYRQLNRITETKEWLERARQAFGTDSRLGSRLAVTTADLADLYRATSDYPEAERLLREALGSPACDQESKWLLRNNLADLLREEGRSTEAEPLFKESIDFSGAPWKQRVGALVGLADIDRAKGDWETSINHWNEALEICRRERDAAGEALAMRGLGITWLKAGEPARAEPLLRRSLRIIENNANIPPEQIASGHSGLAELYRSENKLALAEGEWSRALRIDRAALGDAHPQVALLMEMLADVYSARKEFSLARDYATRASDAMRSSFGENSMAVAAALTNRAAVEEQASALDAAAKDYQRALDIARFHPENQSFQIVVIRRYAGLLKAMHRSREAKALLTQGGIEARSFQSSTHQP
jgi:tetratricopeptide (TPR) repeat protein